MLTRETAVTLAVVGAAGAAWLWWQHSKRQVCNPATEKGRSPLCLPAPISIPPVCANDHSSTLVMNPTQTGGRGRSEEELVAVGAGAGIRAAVTRRCLQPAAEDYTLLPRHLRGGFVGAPKHPAAAPYIRIIAPSASHPIRKSIAALTRAGAAPNLPPPFTPCLPFRAMTTAGICVEPRSSPGPISPTAAAAPTQPFAPPSTHHPHLAGIATLRRLAGQQQNPPRPKEEKAVAHMWCYGCRPASPT